MGIISWVLVGVLVGFIVIARLKARGLVLMGYLVVSVVGALLGGLNIAYLYQLPGAMNGIHWMAVLAAVIGALLANTLMRLLLPRKKQTV